MNSEQLYSMLASLSPRSAMLIGAVLAVLYYLLVFDNGASLDQNLQQAQARIVEAEQQLKATQEAFANAERFEREVKSIVDQFAVVIEYMPEGMNSTDLMSIVSELTTKTGLKLVRTEPISGGEKGTFYEPIRMSFAFEGSFAQILTFLSEISKVPRLITFEGVDLSTVPNSDPEMPQLLFSGTIVAYRYIAKAATNTPDSQPGGNQ